MKITFLNENGVTLKYYIIRVFWWFYSLLKKELSLESHFPSLMKLPVSQHREISTNSPLLQFILTTKKLLIKLDTRYFMEGVHP